MASPEHFPPTQLPPDFEFHFPMQTTPWGKWYDVDWVQEALCDAETCGGVVLEDVKVEAFANTWYV